MVFLLKLLNLILFSNKSETLKLILLIFVSFLFTDKVDSQTNENLYSQNTYGGTGLIQMPTARFSPDGEFLFGISSEEPYNRLFSKMQFFPWMEAVVRYTEGTFKSYQPGIDQTWKDKGLDLKFKLYESPSKDLSLALGLTDFGGTGAFSSEYLVASKAIRNFDITLGLGWGSLNGNGNINNFISSLDSQRRIRGGYSSLGGKINLDRLFSGSSISAFGGIEYFSPLDNLSIKLEYDSADYSDVLGKEKVYNEKGDIFKLDSRINYALNYRFEVGEREKIDFSLGYIRGNTIYANLSVHSNLNFSGRPKIKLGGERIRNTNLPGGNSFNSLDHNRQKFLFNRTIKEMERIGVVTHAVIYNGDEILAEISQSRFLDTSQAIDLASRVLANNSPRNIKKISIINLDNGLETFRSSVRREDLIKSVRTGPLDQDLIEYNYYAPSDEDEVIVQNDFLYPNFYWEIKPRINNTLQHQEKFFFWQLEANITGVYSFKKGLYLTTQFGINIDNNFDDYTYHIPDGELHHVRQDRRLYLTEGETGLRRMVLDYLLDLHPNIKGKFSVGYLEWMYGGLGGEVLYIPDDKRWAIGIDAHWVKQRDFNQKFSFQDYETVTGFLSYYRDIPFYDMRLKISAGKFLGKDIGTMIDVSRRFDNGARVGGFAALTDCDPECVGEGSFHKGIYFELPMDLFYVQSSTRNKTGYSWSPLTKDAGAKLERAELYELMTDATDEVESLRQKSWSIKKIFSGFGTQAKLKL